MPKASWKWLMLLASVCAALMVLQLGCAAAGEANERVNLRLKFKQGRECTVHVKTNVAGQMRLTVNGDEKKAVESDILVDAVSSFAETVKLVGEDGEGLVELKVKEIKLDGVMFGQKMTMVVDEGRIIFGMGEFKIDTNALPDEQRKRIHRLLFGPLILTMQPDGKVTSSAGFERLQFAIPNFDPQEFFANMPPLLPDEPVEVGATWERRLSIPIPTVDRPLPVNFVFKLKSVHVDEAIKHRIATIGISSKVEVQDVETVTQLPQIRKPIKMRIDSGVFAVEGEGQFDITEGTVLQVELKFDLSFKQSADVPKELLREEGLIEKEQRDDRDETTTMMMEISMTGSLQVHWAESQK